MIPRMKPGPLLCSLLVFAAVMSGGDETYAALNPAAITITVPKDIQWVDSANGQTSTAVLLGDPSKPGYYIIVMKWRPGSGSRPHTHPNARYVNVLSGTWWVGTGKDYNKDSMKPVPAGSFVVHTANEIHYDGAKDEEVIVQIQGMGPTSAPRPDAKLAPW